MHAPTRLHGREQFFKYLTADTARLVLLNRSLRWSSPVLFNDPFDVPRELLFGVTTSEVLEALRRKRVTLIDDPPEDTSKFLPNVQIILEAAKRGGSLTLRAELASGLEDVLSNHPPGNSMDELRDQWRTWLPDHRILCLAESPDHAAMWYHYADKYRGVVLELKCIDELDSAWLAAKQVTYPPSKPAIYTADGWAELLCLNQRAAIDAIFEAATYTKTPDWSYESEWRIASFKHPTDVGEFTDYTFSRLELGVVFFGPMIKADDRLSLMLAAGAYPTARFWDVEIGMSREFTFHALA